MVAVVLGLRIGVQALLVVNNVVHLLSVHLLDEVSPPGTSAFALESSLVTSTCIAIFLLWSRLIANAFLEFKQSLKGAKVSLQLLVTV